MPNSCEICMQETFPTKFLYARAKNQWACISMRFHEKGFVSEHPLYITSQLQSLGLASSLLWRIAARNYVPEHHDGALEMPRNCDFVRRIPERKKRTAHMIRKELEKRKATHEDVHQALCVEKLSSAMDSNPVSVLESQDAVRLFKRKLARHCRSRTERVSKQKLYQL